MRRVLLGLMFAVTAVSARSDDQYTKVELNWTDYDSFGYMIRTEGEDAGVRQVILLVPGIVMLTEEASGIRYKGGNPQLNNMDRLVNRETALILIDVPTSVWYSGWVREYHASKLFPRHIAMVLSAASKRFPKANVSACGTGAMRLKEIGIPISSACSI